MPEEEMIPSDIPSEDIHPDPDRTTLTDPPSKSSPTVAAAAAATPTTMNARDSFLSNDEDDGLYDELFREVLDREMTDGDHHHLSTFESSAQPSQQERWEDDHMMDISI